MQNVGHESKCEKGKSKIMLLVVVVLLLAVCVIAVPLSVMNRREERDKEERYQQYLASNIAEVVSSIEYIDAADVNILGDGQNCQVEISVKMREGQILSAEDEEAIRKMTESVLSGQYSGEIAMTFVPAG